VLGTATDRNLRSELIEGDDAVEDNQAFIRQLDAFGARLMAEAPKVRQCELDAGRIRLATPAERLSLDAVDSADLIASMNDLESILLQTVRIADNGDCTLSPQQRITDVAGNAMRARRPAIRLAAECRELAASQSLTIADGAYFSMLMETNKAITSSATMGGDDAVLNGVIQQLIHDGVFLKMLKNHHVIAMSKHSESDKILRGIPDRITMEYVLEPGEFTVARRLQDLTKGNFGRTFGVEQRSFTASDWRWVRDCYQESLGAIFYTPHPWSRAFRIEAHLDQLVNDTALMPVLAAIRHHTTDRQIVEPWPQFADTSEHRSWREGFDAARVNDAGEAELERRRELRLRFRAFALAFERLSEAERQAFLAERDPQEANRIARYWRQWKEEEEGPGDRVH
jgi:hypothetical protein